MDGPKLLDMESFGLREITRNVTGEVRRQRSPLAVVIS
jgi:hypothetical protein